MQASSIVYLTGRQLRRPLIYLLCFSAGCIAGRACAPNPRDRAEYEQLRPRTEYESSFTPSLEERIRALKQAKNSL